MKKIIAFLLFVSINLVSNGQCSSLGISVSSSDTSSIQLYHAGFFLLPSGSDNICEWEITSFSNDIIHQATTSGEAFEQGVTAFDHSIPITDSMQVNLIITNNTEGTTCTINDTLYWEATEVLPGSFIGAWAILSNNVGVEEELNPLDGFELSIKAFLEGAYSNNGIMTSSMGTLIPNTQPYTIIPWSYFGSETLNSIPENMVDWVLVEARTGTPSLSGNPGTTIIEMQAGLLLEDGNIVGNDGTPIRFANLAEGEAYYFAIRHRNHLSVLSANSITAGPQMSYDFTTAVDRAFGTNQQKMTTDGKAVMYAGDANADNVIQVTDFDLWVAQPALLDSYEATDFNLDGVIQVTDYDQWFENKAKLGIIEF